MESYPVVFRTNRYNIFFPAKKVFRTLAVSRGLFPRVAHVPSGQYGAQTYLVTAAARRPPWLKLCTHRSS